VALRSSKGRTMRTGPSKKKTKKADKGEPKKGKKMTKWEDSKPSKKEIEELDRSKEVRCGWVHDDNLKISDLTYRVCEMLVHCG
jgi:hypothetical protein